MGFTLWFGNFLCLVAPCARIMPKCGGFCHYEIWKTGAFCAFISIWAQISKKKALDLYRTFALVLFQMLGINKKKTRHLFCHVFFFQVVLFLQIFSKDQLKMVFNCRWKFGALKMMADPSIPNHRGEPTNRPRLLRDLASTWVSTLTSTEDFLGDENVKSASVKTHKSRGGPKCGAAKKKTAGEHKNGGFIGD